MGEPPRGIAVTGVRGRHATRGHRQHPAQGAFFRAAPSTSSDKQPLPEGTRMRLTGRDETAYDSAWSEIKVPHLGRAGWLATKYLVEPR